MSRVATDSQEMKTREELPGTFQYFGTATTDAAGNFVFRTLTPGAGAGQAATLQLRVRRQDEILSTTAWSFPRSLCRHRGESKPPPRLG